MKHIFVRPARPSELPQFLDWAQKTENNEFDPSVVRHPTTFTLVAFDKDGPLVYMPIQQPLMLESLAIRPGAETSDIAMAMKELIQAAVTCAYSKGAGEVYFLSTEEGTSEMAEKQAGFEKLPWAVYRVKLRDLEGQ